jgi:hypothetical protein
VLIGPGTRRVAVFQAQADGRCLYIDMTERGSLAVHSVGFELPLAMWFKGLDSGNSAAA